MQTINQPKKDAATFRIKKARRIEITLKKGVLKNFKVLQPKAEQ
jgi:hypothetical protein